MNTVFDYYEQYVRDEPNKGDTQKKLSEESEKLFNTSAEETPNNEESGV